MIIRANAKLNLSLSVGEKRPDGYHEIDTVMQSISLYDTVIIDPAAKISVECSEKALSGETNIAYRTAEKFFNLTGIRSGAAITILKRIPCAAGLGGGSADAAAVLCGLDRLFSTNLGEKDLCAVAVDLGADVPFFIRGGTQRARGIGEKLESLPEIPHSIFVVAKPGEKSSTGEMYRRLDETHPEPVNVENTVSAISAGDLNALALSSGNSFAIPEQTDRIKKLLAETMPLAVSLSGSGPSVFAIYDSENPAKDACKLLEKSQIPHWRVIPCPAAILFES